MSKHDRNLCFLLDRLQYPHSPAVEAFGELKPSHLPSRCPRLLLNQLFSFPPLSACQNEPNVFLFPPAAKQPGGLRELQKDCSLNPNSGFCRVSRFGCSVIVHICALAELAQFLWDFESFASGTICRIPSFKRQEALAVPFGRRTERRVWVQKSENIMRIWTWSDWICRSGQAAVLLRQKRLMKCSTVTPKIWSYVNITDSHPVHQRSRFFFLFALPQIMLRLSLIPF